MGGGGSEKGKFPSNWIDITWEHDCGRWRMLDKNLTIRSSLTHLFLGWITPFGPAIGQGELSGRLEPLCG